MLRQVLLTLSVAAVFAAGGCGDSSPRVDTSSGEKLTASLEAMRKGMTEEALAGFNEDVMTLLFRDGLSKASTDDAEVIYKPYHGFTAAQLRAEAAKVRVAQKK